MYKINEINAYFGEDKPYGVIANRINSYSVNLLDAPELRALAKNLKAYGIVAYDLAGKRHASMEGEFCLSDNIAHDSIYEAINNVYFKVKYNGDFYLN